MDANGLRPWLLARADDWRAVETPPAVRYDEVKRRLRLAAPPVAGRPPATTPPVPSDELRARAELRLAAIPRARDAFGALAWWDPEAGMVVARGVVAPPPTLGEGLGRGPTPPIPIFPIGPGGGLTDLAVGHDGVLYLAVAGTVVLLDLRERWAPVTLSAAGFVAWRLAADREGVWVLDRDTRQLGRVGGAPLPARLAAGLFGPRAFRPCAENADPPRLTVRPLGLPAEDPPVALAADPDGRLALLTWAGEDARVRISADGAAFGPPRRFLGARFPHSVAWLDGTRLAVLTDDAPNEALVYEPAALGDDLLPAGDFYPLRAHDGGPFVHGLTAPPHYGTRPGTSAPLHPLSLPSFARRGEATNRRPLDSGDAHTVWHRLYLEAVIPPGCGVAVHLAATDEPDLPLSPDDWHEHRFGDPFPRGGGGLPRAAWVPSPSELPFHPGLLGCARVPGRVGLFTVLVQRANRPVRALRGRYLRVRLELLGDGRSSPEVAALRAYGPRFSYVDAYLPELYREATFGEAAERRVDPAAPGAATRADFLERFLDNFEGVFTPLEDRIAHAYLVTDPAAAPAEALDWLGSWVGVAFDPASPPERRRALLRATPELYRLRGTLAGLRLALDVATGGSVAGGEVVPVEDFRLRRTFATILGADLADETDPLTAGLAVSGNSLVGDTLVLGEEHRAEFLALFAADLAVSAAEADAIAALFDRLAHRLTVLVHQELAPQDLGLIRRVVEAETPAHVEARVVTATAPFLVGVGALVGVDTYLSRDPGPRPVELGRSQVGTGDRVLRPPSLDPRLGGVRPPPVAHLAGVVATVGAPFRLDGGGSRAAPGRTLARYRWTLVEET